MPGLNALFKKLSSSAEFKGFKLKNKSAFLTACFLVVEGGSWQFDFYDSKSKLVTSFEVSDVIKVSPADKVLRDKDSAISELELPKVKVGFDKALKLSQDFIAFHYPSDKFFTKTIVILQNFKGSVIWNFTFLTSTLKLINIKLDAVSGKVLSHVEESFLSMK